MDEKKKIAIIGSGISGLFSAFELHQKYHVTVFEKASRLGGHTDTHDLIIDGKPVRVDSGFIVFCEKYYPNFCRMLNQLEVESESTSMSFSAFNEQSNIVYNATSINRLFCQRRNLFKPSFYRMVFDIVRFYITSKSVLNSSNNQMTVKQYLDQNKYSTQFKDDHLYPMISALWSATPEFVAQFPIRHLIEFLSKHGMMNVVLRPNWKVIRNGSNSYIEALQQKIECEWLTDSPVKSVVRSNGRVKLQTNAASYDFDAVIFATHSDQALNILEDPSDDERSILGSIKYQQNHMVVHTDERLMHPNKRSWASWNTKVPSQLNPNSLECCTATYWMNLLQNLCLSSNVFATLNSHDKINPEKILLETHYSHPIFTPESVAAQKRKNEINGNNNTYYVGAYWGWGFHEDGARSAVEATSLIKQQLN